MPSLDPLYVVLLNLNTSGETIECIDSLAPTLPPGARIVVVDNGSADDSVRVLVKRFGDDITLLRNECNLGFAGGMNVGIRHALAEGAGAVLVLNNDIIVASDMVGWLREALGDDPTVGAVGPIIYYHDEPKRIWHYGDNEQPGLPFPRQLDARHLQRMSGAPFRVDYLTFCAMLVRREVFEAIGLLDTRYLIYYEDADFCRRMRAAGYTLWAVPRATMWHKVSVTMRKQAPRMRYAQFWGRAEFYRVHPHGPSRLLSIAYLVAKGVQTTLHDVRAGHWDVIRPTWQGTLDGCLGRPCKIWTPPPGCNARL